MEAGLEPIERRSTVDLADVRGHQAPRTFASCPNMRRSTRVLDRFSVHSPRGGYGDNRPVPVHTQVDVVVDADGADVEIPPYRVQRDTSRCRLATAITNTHRPDMRNLECWETGQFSSDSSITTVSGEAETR